MFFKKMSFEKCRSSFPNIILALLIGLAINMYNYKVEINRINDNMETVSKSIDELQWNYVETIIKDEYLGAGIQAKMMAERVDRDLKKNYPDMSLLLYQLDFPDKVDNPAYVQIFKDDIRNMFYLGIKNDNNDPFIASRNGIMMDLSLNCSPDDIPRTWEKEFSQHYNPELARRSVNKILLKSHSIAFWEFPDNDNPDHYMMKEPTFDELHTLFMREGLEGLKNVEFLAPAYITEDGDIFGVDDVNSYGGKTVNHKIIIVQGFNLYDQIHSKYLYQFNMYSDRKDTILREIKHVATIRTITEVSMCLVIVIIIFILIRFNNYMFHEDGCCPCDSKKKEGESK